MEQQPNIKSFDSTAEIINYSPNAPLTGLGWSHCHFYYGETPYSFYVPFRIVFALQSIMEYTELTDDDLSRHFDVHIALVLFIRQQLAEAKKEIQQIMMEDN